MPKSMVGPGSGQGPGQRMGQGPVTKVIFKIGQGGCLEVHVSNQAPLRKALQRCAHPFPLLVTTHTAGTTL